MLKFFEILPAALSWITLVLMVLISWKGAFWASIFIILFDTYWLLKTIYLSFHLKYSFSKMRKDSKENWLNKLDLLNNDQRIITNDTKNPSTSSGLRWKDIFHLIILPMYNEPYELIKESFEGLANTNYPKEKFIIVLAAEERAGEKVLETAEKIKNEFGDKFFKFLITNHPDGVPGEIPGKGSNESYAAQEAKIIIDTLKINYENILVSVFDVDTQIGAEYFGLLTYKFMTCEKPQRSSFQPIPLFINNIYEAPALGRVVAFSATFWHMMQQARPERLTTFSSHSMPFKALMEVGYWQKDIVSEDSRIFWQLFLHYDGDWRVEPMFYPVSMDANVAPGFWKTMINTYKQQRRWSWGAENVPYILEGFRNNKKIPFRTKLYWAFNIIEGFHSWATNAILIFALGWLPILIGGKAFDRTILAYNLPQITQWILTLTTIGIASSATLSIVLLPPKPKGFKVWHYAIYVLQWVLMPYTMILFGALPGLDAQTRLALGGKFRLGFWVTPKGRYKNSG
jgi:cellulose synthase/poly-beta-1,6-N-acetylglucosamine synthase-like glycosyltransferase